MFKRVLIANRGEVALRIIRTLREMNIGSVAAYADPDRDAPFVLAADEAYRLGPGLPTASYLNRDGLIGCALRAGCQAIHPGYGFLAENPEFAQAVAEAGLTFIGPSPQAMRLMGDKIAARRVAVETRVPVVRGSNGPVGSIEEARAFASEHGFPLMVKAGGGGGGRGMRVVESESQLGEALDRASREAQIYFGNPAVYLERFFRGGRHIEVQLVGDSSGNVVGWGERDCSTQRRRQKLIEETPAPGISDGDRRALTEFAIRLVKRVAYVGLGTVEFLCTGPGEFHFLEMNTRIQVEHPITEEVTGHDLVRESIQVAFGETALDQVTQRGHAIEVRINAEDPGRNFAPGHGLITLYREPGGPGIRVDTGVCQGFIIPSEYDSLVAKLIVRGPTREHAIQRLLRALREFEIGGVPTTIPLVKSIVDTEVFRSGRMTTDWLDGHLEEVGGLPQHAATSTPSEIDQRSMDVEVNGKRFSVRIYEESQSSRARLPRPRASPLSSIRSAVNEITSAMHGTVMAVRKSVGDAVRRGEAVFVVEAMKMENDVTAPRDGRLASILVAVGDTIEVHQTLAQLEPQSSDPT